MFYAILGQSHRDYIHHQEIAEASITEVDGRAFSPQGGSGIMSAAPLV